MQTLTFAKLNGSWYISHNPYYHQDSAGQNNPLLEGSEAILNLLAGNGTSVTVTLDTEPFENSDVLELMQLCQPFLEGGYYYMHQYAGQNVDFKIWLCDVPKYAFGTIPDRIYLRRS
jgi:hypothetical protein